MGWQGWVVAHGWWRMGGGVGEAGSDARVCVDLTGGGEGAGAAVRHVAVTHVIQTRSVDTGAQLTCSQGLGPGSGVSSQRATCVSPSNHTRVLQGAKGLR